MDLNPKNWPIFNRGTGRKAPPGANTPVRAGDAMGPYSKLFEEWVAREVNPRLYEALREAVPVLDGAIARYVMLDGIIGVDGENPDVVQEVRGFMDSVRVNDFHQGFQAFYTLSGNEMYEQGHAISEIRFSPARDAVTRLIVGDSKGVYFRRAESGELETWYRPPGRAPNRGDASLGIERILRNQYRNNIQELLQDWHYKKLDNRRLVHMTHAGEADNPYGTSLLRSLEFVSQVLLTVTNSVKRTWSRFGDPVHHLNYGTNAKIDAEELERRRQQFADLLTSALKIKADGNSADLVTATGKDDLLKIEIVGAGNDVLELEWPNRHVIEQMLSKLDLPGWMLGFHFSTAERLALKQCELLLQAARTRFALRKPALRKPIEAHLRARGITWRPGDWDLVQDLPNVSDLVAQAQAGFLEAQTEMMRSDSGNDSPDVEPVKVSRAGRVVLPTDDEYPGRKRARRSHRHQHKESFVEDDEELPRLESRTEAVLVKAWHRLREETLRVLGLPNRRKAEGDGVFIFEVGDIDTLIEMLDRHISEQGAADSVLVQNVVAAWTRGTLNAADELDGDRVGDDIRAGYRAAAARAQLDQVRSAVVRDYQREIIERLMDGAYNGMNPDDVARALRKRFGAAEYNWRRLARTEISHAQFLGKLAQYAAHGISEYDWIIAPDACPICVSLASGGPYLVGVGPTPRTDSHPECRCTATAVAPDPGED